MGRTWLVGKPAEVLAADGLVLRRWRAEDIADLADAVVASRDHLAPWMSWASDFGPSDAEEFVTSIIDAWDAGEDFTYGIWDGDQLVGACGLHDDLGPGRLELGYWVHVDHVGRGVARRATAAIVRAAFSLDGVQVLEIRHADTNTRSAGVPEALGFRHDREIPRDADLAGDTDTTVVWELSRSDVPLIDA